MSCFNLLTSVAPVSVIMVGLRRLVRDYCQVLWIGFHLDGVHCFDPVDELESRNYGLDVLTRGSGGFFRAGFVREFLGSENDGLRGTVRG